MTIKNNAYIMSIKMPYCTRIAWVHITTHMNNSFGVFDYNSIIDLEYKVPCKNILVSKCWWTTKVKIYRDYKYSTTFFDSVKLIRDETILGITLHAWIGWILSQE